MATLENVSTSSEDNKSIVEIHLTRPFVYKVIPMDRREIVIAIKDVEIGGDVFANEMVLGDPFVKQIKTTRQPGNVASVIVTLLKPLRDIQYHIQRSKTMIRLELGEVQLDKTKKEKVLGDAEREKREGIKWVEEWGGTEKEKKKGTLNKTKVLKPLSDEEKILKEAADTMEQRGWKSAMVILEDFVSSHPESPLVERAQFLLAKCFHQSRINEIPQFLLDITERYQIALSKYPKSRFAPDALISMGKTYMAAGQHFEALANFDRVLNEFKEAPEVAEAVFQRGRALAKSKKPLMAIREFEQVERRFPESDFVLGAKLELAKTLFDIKSFKRSLRLLGEIIKGDGELVRKEPHVLLYMGYNYYELGQLQEARGVLSEALNLFPELESTDLLLTRIADTYREDGLEEKASKLYDLVARTYPKSQGSLISLLRVAEGLESKGMSDDSEKREDGEKSVKRAHEIYSQIMAMAPQSPLAQVAMLKLATFQKKNKRYQEAIDTLKELLKKDPKNKLKEQVEVSLQDTMLRFAIVQKEKKNTEQSVETLKELLTAFPKTDLMDDIRPVLEESLAATFKQKRKTGNLERVIKYYDGLEKVLPFEQMPDIMLEVADA